MSLFPKKVEYPLISQYHIPNTSILAVLRIKHQKVTDFFMFLGHYTVP